MSPSFSTRRALMASLLIGLSWQCAASAQEATPAPAAKNSPEDRLALARFGRCIVDRHHDDAALVIATDLTYDEALQKFPDLIGADCAKLWAGASDTARQGLIQWAIADALLTASPNENFAIEPKPAPLEHRIFGPRQDLDRELVKIKDAKLRKRVEWAASVYARFGECMARREPEKARALFLTEPESDGEKASFLALRGAANSCVRIVAPAKGSFVTGLSWSTEVPYLAFRGGLAVSYYRLAATNPGNAGAGSR